MRSWFADNKTKLRLPDKGSNLRTESQELILPFFEKEPDWDKFHHYYFPDAREVFEINLSNDEVPVFGGLLDSIPNIPLNQLVIQNILFVEDVSGERFDPIIARYYPKAAEDILDFKKISYQSINQYWSGRLDLFTYDEHHFVSFEFDNGEIINELTFKKNGEGAKTKNNANSLVRCTSYLVPVTNCVSAGGSTYCSTNYNDLVTVTSCSRSSTSGGSTGGSYTYTYTYGGSGSGGTIIDPNGAIGTEYYVPAVPAPHTFVLDQLNHPCASSIFRQLMKASIIKSSVGNLNQVNAIIQLLNDANNIDFVVKKANLAPGISGNTSVTSYINTNTGNREIEITFDTNYLNTATRLSIARTILHETIHAFLVYNFFKDPAGEFTLGLVNYGATKGYINNQNIWHHNFMSQYVEAMGYSLAIWNSLYGDSNSIPRSYFDDLAWGGLTYKSINNGVYTWQDSFLELVPSQTERLRIQENINKENSNYNANGTPCN